MERLEALPLPEPADEIMTKAFKADYTPGEGLNEIGGIADYFLPDNGAPRLGDTTPEEMSALNDLLARGRAAA